MRPASVPPRLCACDCLRQVFNRPRTQALLIHTPLIHTTHKTVRIKHTRSRTAPAVIGDVPSYGKLLHRISEPRNLKQHRTPVGMPHFFLTLQHPLTCPRFGTPGAGRQTCLPMNGSLMGSFRHARPPRTVALTHAEGEILGVMPRSFIGIPPPAPT
jgi:hypothetical protein